MATTSAGIRMRVFNGTRELFPKTAEILYRVIDGTQKDHGRFLNASDAQFKGLPVFDNMFDDYRVIVSAGRYQDAGLFPVKVKAGEEIAIDLMLVTKHPVYNFAQAAFANLTAIDPKVSNILSADLNGNADGAAQRWSDRFEAQPPVAACLLNLLTVMADNTIAGGQQILSFLKQVIWDDRGENQMAQDRFFGWADKTLIDRLQQPPETSDQVRFEPADPGLHPGATRSWKAKQYSEANIQLTFHENDTPPAGHPDWVKVEPDIDYFDDKLAHFFLEVIPNHFSGSLTDPSHVLSLRWMAEHRAGKDFDPLYTILPA